VEIQPLGCSLSDFEFELYVLFSDDASRVFVDRFSLLLSFPWLSTDAIVAAFRFVWSSTFIFTVSPVSVVCTVCFEVVLEFALLTPADVIPLVPNPRDAPCDFEFDFSLSCTDCIFLGLDPVTILFVLTFIEFAFHSFFNEKKEPKILFLVAVAINYL